jgi:hypothetical protein
LHHHLLIGIVGSAAEAGTAVPANGKATMEDANNVLMDLFI